MKTFSYFILTIFFAACVGLILNNLDPGIKTDLNIKSLILISIFLFLTIDMFYTFVMSFFYKEKLNKYQILRGLLLAFIVISVFLLKILNLLSLPSFIILIIIYILSEFTLFELNKR